MLYITGSQNLKGNKTLTSAPRRNRLDFCYVLVLFMSFFGKFETIMQTKYAFYTFILIHILPTYLLSMGFLINCFPSPTPRKEMPWCLILFWPPCYSKPLLSTSSGTDCLGPVLVQGQLQWGYHSVWSLGITVIDMLKKDIFRLSRT